MKGGQGALGQIMRQAQQMQEKMKRLQEEIARAEVVGESGAGMVKITMTGRHQVHRVEIQPEAMGEDREFLEDLIAAAVNDAVQRVEALNKEKMSEAAGGLNLPPGFNLNL